jgi:hypothetical protein
MNVPLDRDISSGHPEYMLRFRLIMSAETEVANKYSPFTHQFL